MKKRRFGNYRLLGVNVAGVVNQKVQTVVCSRKAFAAKMVFLAHIVERELGRDVGLDIVVKIATWIITASAGLTVVDARATNSYQIRSAKRLSALTKNQVAAILKCVQRLFA